MSEPPQQTPNPEFILETLTGYQRADALRVAIELDLFTGIGSGATTVSGLAERCKASERGVRMLCDYLVVQGFLVKNENTYVPSTEATMFLDRRSPGFMGDAVKFLASPALKDGFAHLLEAVRKGGTAASAEGTTAQEHEAWIAFARGMAPLMAPTARALADLVQDGMSGPVKVLDIAAGHGLFGIELARRLPESRVVALDWPQVLAVARENAASAGVADRFDTIEGSAFDVDTGRGYDVVILANLLHHFDAESCERLMRKVHGSLAERGRAVVLEYVPDPDRVAPPRPAAFALVMLATTPSGDAYTLAEYERIFDAAGFSACRLHQLEDSVHQVLVVRS